MKVAITGAAGMLARDLIDVLAPEYELLLIDRLDSCKDRGYEFACMDLVDESKLGPAIKNSDVGLVFHCAAFTDVDSAEGKVDEAYRANALATASVAAACREAGIEVLQQATLKQLGITIDYAYLDTLDSVGVILEFIQTRFLGLKARQWPFLLKLAARIQRRFGFP